MILVVLTLVLMGFALLSILLNLWQWIAACRFPIHSRSATRSNSFPGVSLLKPLKGFDSETAGCLESWFQQSYGGPVQILFGVAEASDRVCDLVRRLIVKYPEVKAALIICGKDLGANAKVSTLIQLQEHAHEPFLVVSDADVAVPRGFLADMMNGFTSPKTGLVNCFYELENPRTTAMHWEAIAVNSDFWSQVLQGNMIKPMDFALGAVMAIRASCLQQIGGFSALADYLADDYQLGHQVVRSGSDISLCTAVASCRGEKLNGREVWNHQLRWARTIRFCQPAPWFLSIISNATLWPLIAALALWTRPAFILLAVALLLRIATSLHNQGRLTRSHRHFAWFWLIPIKDILQFALWASSFLGSTVVWRSVKYRVLPGGRLVICK